MQRVAIVCGAGQVTSMLLMKQVADHLAKEGIPAEVLQATVMDLLSPQFTADVVVSTVMIPEALGIPVVSGMPLLLNSHPEHALATLVKLLRRSA